MLIKRGIPVSPGVVSGPALVLGAEDFRIPQRYVSVDAVESEIARFQTALQVVCDEISENEQLATKSLGKQYGAIFSAHLQMVQDPKLRDEIIKLIRDRHLSPEFASSRVLRRFAKMFQNLGNKYLADRADDIFDLEKRILRHLLGERREELMHLTAPVVILAHNLTPGETATLPKQFVLGFATEVGGRTSHTAILAGALEIPAVVGVGGFLSDVAGGEMVIIDGTRGEILIDPDEETLGLYRDSQARLKTMTQRLESLQREPSQTRDRVRITLLGNIEFPEEVEHCTQRGARRHRPLPYGISLPAKRPRADRGRPLCRVFAGDRSVPRRRGRDPDLGFGGRQVSQCLRFPVIGAEKLGAGTAQHSADAAESDVVQNAVTRYPAQAATGNVGIMFPLVSSLLELRQAKMILEDVKEDLEDAGVAFKRDIPVGMMVEVPSAALMADEFAREVDFFSVGTNDLIQYTLAVDRSDPDVANLYSSGDPSILRLLRLVVEAGRKRDIPVTVCGQMSSDPKFIPLLLGMGIKRLSVTPHSIPQLKEVIRTIDFHQAGEIAGHALTLDLARDVENYLRGELKKICPDLVT